MYAIVEIAGQQFKVAKDQNIFVHRLAVEEGEKITFDNVLLLDDGKITIGAPAIEGAAVEAKVLRHLKGDKVIVFKKKRRKGYRVKNGHRQYLTEISIENIIGSGAKKTAAVKAPEANTEKAGEEKPKKQAVPKAKVATKAPAPAPEEKAAPPKKKTAPKASAATEDLSKKTVAQLKEMAKAKGITGISAMKKADLIAALNK